MEALTQVGGVAGSSNLSLALNRFVDTWRPGFVRHDDERRRRFLQACCQIAAGPRPRELLEQYHARQEAVLAAYSRDPWHAQRVRATLTRRLVIGLGIAHPLETNLALHRIGGFPYVPGSSIKGAARAVAEEQVGGDGDVVRIAFGPAPGEPDHEQGALVFFDALPVPGFRLAIDVMTPHHSAYYTGQEPPADWQGPNPILFLTVERGAIFRFAVAARRRADTGGATESAEAAAQRLDQALGWLREALRDGLGGKRSAGYGAFEVIE